jgi:thymidylate synthase ThyX
MDIIIVDHLPPETVAMLQALYSRSPSSVRERLLEVKDPTKFMAQYYVGYGHKSIGDCGTTSIFIENVSLLAAKAIQDSPLYNGQEASTRYLDMSKQALISPIESKIQSDWMDLYTLVLSAMIPVLSRRYPRQDGEKESIWAKAIKAKAFDIARGFLPAGITTYVAWHTNLRQAADQLKMLRHHPLTEVRSIAEGIHNELLLKYPSSFSHKMYLEEEKYLSRSVEAFAYHDEVYPFFEVLTEGLLTKHLKQHESLLRNRPAHAELHQRFRQYGNITFNFMLDFGSYRDLQRQRSAVQEMPLLTIKHGFNQWYLEQLGPSLCETIQFRLRELEIMINDLNTTDTVKQYYTAIGYNVAVSITCPLPAAVYIAELRSSDSVHPTLRVQAQRMGEALKQIVPYMAMHHDLSPGSWSLKRGEQDIVKC